jgi:hypothetical protein
MSRRDPPSPRRRLPPLVVATSALAACGLGSALLCAAPAVALAPVAYGWWSTTNSGQAPAGVPLAAPVPPDVPSNGMLIEGGAQRSAPTAFGAVRYVVPAGQTPSTLSVSVASGSASTPSTVLEACPLVDPAFVPVEDGPMSQAPAYDCSRGVTASPSAQGTGYSFAVSGLVAGGELAVAIVPTAATDRVVLDEPGAASLALSGPPPSSTRPAPSAAGSGPLLPLDIVAALSGVATPPAANGPPPSASKAPAGAGAPAARARPAPTVLGSSAPIGIAPLHPQLVVLAVLGALAAAAMWLWAGRRATSKAGRPS